MKRTTLFICCFLLIFLLCACKDQKEDLVEPVNFYYANSEITFHSDDGVLAKEMREGASFHGNLSAFLHAYLRGPESSSLESIIPSDVYLVSCRIEDKTATIVLSSQFSALSGLKLTTACSGLLLTLHDYADIEILCIQSKGERLDGKDSIILSLDDIILTDATQLPNQ